MSLKDDKTRCRCECHVDDSVKHVIACCDNGWKFYDIFDVDIKEFEAAQEEEKNGKA